MSYDIAIIGAGPGGYLAAIKAAQMGASIALIEENGFGGTCLNKGCIPTKAMLASVHCLKKIKLADSFGIKVSTPEVEVDKVVNRQKKIVEKMSKSLEQLLKSYSGIDIYKGKAGFVSANVLSVASDEPKEIQAKNIIVATGSVCASLGELKVDHELIINSDDALNLVDLPEKMIIVGGGAIGIEWSRIFSAFGVNVTIVEMLDKLAPSSDKEISDLLLRLFKREKVKVKLGVKVDKVDKTSDQVTVSLSNGETLTADKVLLAVGRRPNINMEGIDKLGLDFDGRFIKVNDFMQTSIPNIYAVGDVIGRLQLAHVAYHEALVAVEHIINKTTDKMDYSCVPFCIYGDPELASVGITEDQALANNLNIEVNKVFYAGNGKAVAESETNGLVKTIIDKDTQQLLGVHIIGYGASDIIHQGVIAIKNKLTKTDFIETIFAHPTISETFHESIVSLHVPGMLKKG